MHIRTVLVEHTSSTGEYLSTSGTLINNKYILIPSSILPNVTTLLPKLRNGLHSASLQNHKFNIVQEHENNFQTELIATLHSPDIKKSIATFLDSWNVDVDSKRVEDKVLSLFLVLGNKGDSFVELKATLVNLRLKCLVKWGVCDKVCVNSVPFANRNFLSSYSEGVVANVVGINGCFLLTDCPTVFGSEGSLIYLKKSRNIPLGIVISSMNWWKGEWLGLTLGATLWQLLGQIGNKENIRINHIGNEICDQFNNSVVQVVCDNYWGSAILVDKQHGIFLTNSHVVDNLKYVNIHWNKLIFQAEVVYKTSHSDYNDMAILKIIGPSLNKIQKTTMAPLRILNRKPLIGDPIFAAGFPIFPAPLMQGPTITAGNISKIGESIIFTTATVLAGASGGALVTKDGALVAMITSNAKSNDNDGVFPRINMSIPIRSLWPHIRNFIKTQDLQHLKDVPNLNDWRIFNSKL